MSDFAGCAYSDVLGGPIQSLTVCPQACWRGFHSKPIGQGGRGRVVTGHSFRTVPQPSTTHAPEIVKWHPGPQRPPAAAGMKLARIAADKIASVLMRYSFRTPRTPIFRQSDDVIEHGERQ